MTLSGEVYKACLALHSSFHLGQHMMLCIVLLMLFYCFFASSGDLLTIDAARLQQTCTTAILPAEFSSTMIILIAIHMLSSTVAINMHAPTAATHNMLLLSMQAWSHFMPYGCQQGSRYVHFCLMGQPADQSGIT